MPQDAFHIHVAVEELNSLLKGGKINRISQVDKDELTFIIYTGFRTVKLILSTNASFARICTSKNEKEPASVAPNFCMLLRKHLLGAEILEVSQHGFERIIEIKMHCVSDFSACERTLVAEVMGKYSNLVLVENGVILGALKTTSLENNTKRILFSGAKYLYPEPQDKISPFEPEKIKERYIDFVSGKEILESEDVAQFIFENVSGLAMATARIIVNNLPTDKNIWDYVGEFCSLKNIDVCPCVAYSGATPTDFFAVPVQNGVKTSSFLEAEDVYYTYRETNKIFAEKKQKLFSALRSLKKKQLKNLADTLSRLQDAEGAEKNKIYGELITANMYRLEKGMTGFETENWYSENCETVKIKLDPLLSPNENAQRYFKTYAKQKRTKDALIPRYEKEKEESEYVLSIESSIELSENLDDLKEIEEELIALNLIKVQQRKTGGKKKEISVPFRVYEKDGFKIYAGRNNIQNDKLIKSVSPTDIWLHTQKYHSSHVVIVTDNKPVPDDTILFASEICAYYSDGKDGDKIPVDYCYKKFVKKPSKAKAGFVIYTDYKTVLVKPDAHRENQIQEDAE